MIGAACLLLGIGGEPVALALRYDRAGLAAGELWRLVTGHLVHLGPAHTAMNVAALVILAFVIEGAMRPAAWFAAAIVSALAIDAGLYWIDDSVEWYVGLSGVLHGLLAAGSLVLWQRGRLTGPLLLAALAAKIVWEQWVGPVPLTQQTAGGPVVVSAHLFGAAGGLLWFTLRRSFHALRARPL